MSRKKVSRNFWKKADIERVLRERGMVVPENLPDNVPQYLVEETLDRAPVSIWRFVKLGILPEPVKIAG